MVTNDTIFAIDLGPSQLPCIYSYTTWFLSVFLICGFYRVTYLLNRNSDRKSNCKLHANFMLVLFWFSSNVLVLDCKVMYTPCNCFLWSLMIDELKV